MELTCLMYSDVVRVVKYYGLLFIETSFHSKEPALGLFCCQSEHSRVVVAALKALITFGLVTIGDRDSN